jgi:hypothetical protein
MKEERLDLANMTVEDLFRAKAERRQRLANLPFEKKIEIVKRLQSIIPFDRDERVRLLTKLTLENAGFRNVAIKCVKLGEGGPGAAHRSASAGTWSVTSDQKAFLFSLTWDEYIDQNDDRIASAVLRNAPSI